MAVRIAFFLSLVFLTSSLAAAQGAPAVNGLATVTGFVPGVAQQPKLPTIVKRVDEVNLLLSVTTRRGRFVDGLNLSDFAIADNGEPPAKITYFQRQTDLPLRVALVVDVSDSERYYLPYEQKAVRSFLKKILRPDRDLALLVSFNHVARLVQPPTSDLTTLKAAVQSLKTDGETAIFDAIALAAQQLESIPDREPVRRVIVLLTDGADNRSKIGLESAVEHVLRAESVLYVVDTKGEVLSDEEQKADGVTKYLSDAAGGRTFKARDAGDVADSFQKIREELRSQYAIGYKPSNLFSGLLFRTVQIFGPKGIRIRHRAGYYAR